MLGCVECQLGVQLWVAPNCWRRLSLLLEHMPFYPLSASSPRALSQCHRSSASCVSNAHSGTSFLWEISETFCVTLLFPTFWPIILTPSMLCLQTGNTLLCLSILVTKLCYTSHEVWHVRKLLTALGIQSRLHHLTDSSYCHGNPSDFQPTEAWFCSLFSKPARREGKEFLCCHSGAPTSTCYNLFIILIYYYCTFAYIILSKILCCCRVRSRGGGQELCAPPMAPPGEMRKTIHGTRTRLVGAV